MSQAPRRRAPLLLWILLAAVLVTLIVVMMPREGDVILGFDRNEFAQLSYLILLLVFIGSALLGRRLGAGEVVRSAAAWLAVLLLLVGAYAYRDELLGVGTRLLGVLAPGVPVPGRLAGGIDAGSVMIVRGMDGHFAVRAEIDAMPLTLMLDTGASFVTLTHDDAAAMGIDTSLLQFRVPVRTANGVLEAAPVTLDSVSVGAITRNNVAGLVAPAGSLDQSLLGMSFLNTLHSYAITGDRLVLTP